MVKCVNFLSKEYERLPNELNSELPCQGVLAWRESRAPGKCVPPRFVTQLLWKHGQLEGVYLAALAELTVAVVGVPIRCTETHLLAQVMQYWSPADAQRMVKFLVSPNESDRRFTVAAAYNTTTGVVDTTKAGKCVPLQTVVVTIAQLKAMMARNRAQHGLGAKMTTAIRALLKPNAAALIGASLDGRLLSKPTSQYESLGALALTDPSAVPLTVCKPVGLTKAAYRTMFVSVLVCIHGTDATTIAAQLQLLTPLITNLNHRPMAPIVQDMMASRWSRAEGSFTTKCSKTEGVVNIKYPPEYPHELDATSALLIKTGTTVTFPRAMWGYESLNSMSIPADISMGERRWLTTTPRLAPLLNKQTVSVDEGTVTREELVAHLGGDADPEIDERVARVFSALGVVSVCTQSGRRTIRMVRRPLKVTICPMVAVSDEVPTIAQLLFRSRVIPAEVVIKACDDLPLYWQHLAYLWDAGVRSMVVQVSLCTVMATPGPVRSAVLGDVGCTIALDLSGIQGPKWIRAEDTTPEQESVAASWCIDGGPATGAVAQSLLVLAGMKDLPTPRPLPLSTVSAMAKRKCADTSPQPCAKRCKVTGGD